MSWIKDNKFMVGLGGGTLVGVILLFVAGSSGSKRYDSAMEDFSSAGGEVASILKLPLSPKQDNLNGKTKALDEYRKSVESLQAAFEAFRPKELKNVSPQEFTTHLKAVNDEVRKAFDDAGTKVPDPFFCGFEKYKTELARGSATGMLEYELGGIRNLMLALAKSGPSELKNLHRPALPEEDGKEFKPADSDVARPLPLEITFVGPEKSLRSFVSSIVKPEGQYAVIRSMRVSNTKKDPPKAADAKFEKPAEARPAAAADVFGGGFVLPGEEPKAEEKKPAATPTPAPAPAPEPAPADGDSSRILSQVLGNEEVQVFLRIDLMQFLPEKKLP
jgi:hypothetical protein